MPKKITEIFIYRSEVIDYMPSMTKVNIKLFIKHSDHSTSMNWKVFINPFSLEIWIIWISFNIVFISAYKIFNQGDEKIFCGNCKQKIADMKNNSLVRNVFLLTYGLTNFVLAKYWEGMLISYLTTQDTYLPFTELKDLYYKTEYKVVVLPKSAYMQSFQIGNDLEKAIWKERIEPYMKAFPVVSRCMFLIYNDIFLKIF